ncbi:Disrupted in schizophrenia 1 protein [Manis javanica]|nr:Disrupted in schizophrenia 1 protein [Manis javanica]
MLVAAWVSAQICFCLHLNPGHPGLLVPPAFSLRKRLARWPGYMRSTAGPRIRFPSPAGSTPFQAQGWGCSENFRALQDSAQRWQQASGQAKQVDSAQAAGGSPRLECGMPSLLDMDTASCSPDPSSFKGSSPEDTHGWETLLRRCEPVLLGCLLSNQRRLEVKSLRLKLQKLQEKSVEDDDYDKGDFCFVY